MSLSSPPYTLLIHSVPHILVIFPFIMETIFENNRLKFPRTNIPTLLKIKQSGFLTAQSACILFDDVTARIVFLCSLSSLRSLNCPPIHPPCFIQFHIYHYSLEISCQEISSHLLDVGNPTSKQKETGIEQALITHLELHPGCQMSFGHWQGMVLSPI